MCLICQQNTSEPLKCPLNAHRSGEKSEAYSSFLINVSTFRGMGTLPIQLAFGEDMTVGELVRNRGEWHKSCHLKFNRGKLERATVKRHREEESSNCVMKRPRRQSMDKMACLFCNQDNGHLHEFRTLGTDESIRQMATELQETELMARVDGGDLIALEAKYRLQCLAALRNRYRSLVRKHEQQQGVSSEEQRMKARALVEKTVWKKEPSISNFQPCINFTKSDFSVLVLIKKSTELDSRSKF